MNLIDVNKILEKSISQTPDQFPLRKILNGHVDYEIEIERRVCGVITKGSRSDIMRTVGEIISSKRVYSHLYLAAPNSILQKVQQLLEQTNMTNIGLITVGANGVRIIRDASEENYFYPMDSQKSIAEFDISLSESEKNMILSFEGRPFSVKEIATFLKTSRTIAYQKINKLKEHGIIEEVVKGTHPKFYKIVTRKQEL